MPSRWGRIVLAVIYLLLALNAWGQVVLRLTGHTSDPRALVAFQAAVGTAALAVVWGCWSTTRWASGAAVVHGVVTASMLLSLGPLLDLPPSARGGLWGGAAVVMVFALWSAWYLRSRREPTADQPHH